MKITTAMVLRAGSNALAGPVPGVPAPTSPRANGVCGQTGQLAATTRTSRLAFLFQKPKSVQTEVRNEIAALNLPSVTAHQHLSFSAALPPFPIYTIPCASNCLIKCLIKMEDRFQAHPRARCIANPMLAQRIIGNGRPWRRSNSVPLACQACERDRLIFAPHKKQSPHSALRLSMRRLEQVTVGRRTRASGVERADSMPLTTMRMSPFSG